MELKWQQINGSPEGKGHFLDLVLDPNFIHNTLSELRNFC